MKTGTRSSGLFKNIAIKVNIQGSRSWSKRCHLSAGSKSFKTSSRIGVVLSQRRCVRLKTCLVHNERELPVIDLGEVRLGADLARALEHLCHSCERTSVGRARLKLDGRRLLQHVLARKSRVTEGAGNSHTSI
eukprot:6188033-Pleurochrysis_carterae.AAC.2